MHPDSGHRSEVPSDFPREEVMGSVGGSQPKLLLKKRADGAYGPITFSEVEVQARFEAADDIVGQL